MQSLLSRFRTKKVYIPVLLIVIALVLPVFLFATTQQQSVRQFAAETHQIRIQNFAMNPQTLTVKVGDTVTWTNQDDAAHDANSISGGFKSPLLNKGESWSHTFTQPGTFEYFCTPHKETMNGYKIIVFESDSAPADQPTVAQGPTPTPTLALPTPIQQATTAPAADAQTTSGTSMALTLQLHGIGSAGDSVNPNTSSLSNKTPKEPERIVALIILDSTGQQVQEPSGKVTYDAASGDFKGNVELGSNFTPGSYTIKIRMKKYLIKKAAENFAIQAGVNTLPPTALTVGDVDSNNILDDADYNAILGCFTEDVNVKKCNVDVQLKSDLNDDGAINTLDANLLQREATAGKGD